MSKPDPIALLGAYSLLPPYDRYTSYRIEWYDNTKRQTVGLSTRTTDLQRAQEIFQKHHLTNTKGGAQTQTQDEPAAQAMARYYVQHASALASAATAMTAMKSANESFRDKLVTQIDADTQKEWIHSLRARGVSDATIRRWMGVVWAAFNYAVTFNHIPKAAVPEPLERRHWGTRTHARKRICGDASRRQLTPQELGRLCDASARTVSGLRYFILALGSGGRPDAIVRLTTHQYDAVYGVLDLNPVGREQNKKYHARIAVAPILGQWLGSFEPRTPQGHYLSRRADAPIDTKNFFKKYIFSSGVRDCVPYTLRHTVASWLAGHGVPKWERSHFMGHKRPDGNTTDDYSHCDPSYLRQCATVVQKLFEAVAPYTQVDLLRHVWDDQPVTHDDGQSLWLDRFLGNDGHRLVGLFTPQAPPSRAAALEVITSVVPKMDAAPARSEGGQDPLNRASPASDCEAAWYGRGTASAEQEENPLKSMGRVGLEPTTNTLKGPENAVKSTIKQ